LDKLFRQDFPNYEVIFVVDSETDEAVSVIRKFLKCKAAKLVISGKAENESQKVHNLREAVLHVSIESEIFVFVDSDARPSENWLRTLIAPLQNVKIGAATAYRWFISPKMNFGSELRSVWNASIASALGEDPKSNFCWGGSMALRREIFEKINMREKWRGTLSDDFTVTRELKTEDLQIFFVPQALTASVENITFSECLEFTTRQMKITRVYSPNLWIMSLIGAGLFNLVFIWGILNLFFYPSDSIAFWISLVSLILTSIFSIGKSWLRLKAVKLVLIDYKSHLEKQIWTQNILWIFTQALFFFNAFSALLSRKITWRGIKYELISHNSTRIIQNTETRLK
jgi:cellulose synthase/poly-beta-1,6-N-acetylglucosamine synthase-like glycosyltransferase